MQNKNNGYKFQLTVNHIDSIKPRQSGSSEIDGQEIVWGHAVKFKSRNIDLVSDEDFGEKEVESTLEIEISCDTMSETVALNNHLKVMKQEGKPFTLDTAIPSKNSGAYSCKAVLKGRDFMDAHKSK